jgi:hypothetical protein
MGKYVIWFLLCLAFLVVTTSLLGDGTNSGKKIVESSTEKGERGIVDHKKEKERDPERDSVETYKDLTKLLISLATGTMVLAPTLLTLWKTGRIMALWSLCISSGFLVGSVICGICVLSTLAGSQHANEYNIDYPLTRLFSIPQWIIFIAGLIFFMVFVFKNLRNRSGEAAQLEVVLDALVGKNFISNEEKGVLLSKIKEL